MEKAEHLEDLLDGQRAIAEYLKEPGIAVDAEEAFGRGQHNDKREDMRTVSSWPC